MTNFRKIRKYQQAGDADAARVRSIVLGVFLAGPFINTKKTIKHKDNNETSAKLLRYSLNQHIANAGHDVYLGEDAQMRLNGAKAYGRKSNAVVHERNHIKNHLDAVIILPSSPGSFCEIGDWVSDKDICKTMLVLIDKRFKGYNNYINLGVVKMASDNKALIEYVDYCDLDVAKELCDTFIADIQSDKGIDYLYNR